jgi:hypothetical protein
MIGHNGNAYVITLNIGPLRKHIHTCSVDPAVLDSTGGRLHFGVFRSSAVAFDLMSSTVAIRVPVRPIFRVGKSQKSLGARSGECGFRMMTRILTRRVIAANTQSRRYELVVQQTVDVKEFREHFDCSS